MGEQGDHPLCWEGPEDMQDTLGWCEEQQCRRVSDPLQCPALPAHLLAVAGGDVWGTRFLAQWLDDGHLGKVLHRLLELRQGPAAIAFATFDVLGLSFWGRICEIQEQSVWVMSFADPAPRSQHTGLVWSQHFKC